MPEDYSLGTAHGEIAIDASSLARATAAFDLLGNKMLLFGGLAVAALGFAIKSAADFEQQMSRFGAVTNASTGQMEKIRQKALQLGRDSAYGATQVVEAFAELGFAGVSTTEILQGMGDAVVYLAAGAEIPLKDASTDLVNTMRQFNVPAKDAVATVDALARAANASTLDMGDLVTSLRYVGPVAAQMGMSVDETAQTLAVLANQGIRGSTAGTSLRGVMLGLTAASAPAKAALHTLGLDTNEVGNNFFRADGSMRSFSEISEILHGSLGRLGQQIFNTNGSLKSNKEINDLLTSSTLTLTEKTKLEAFAHLFQRRAMASAFALARDGKQAFDDLTGSAQYSTTAQELMREKLDNLKGSLKILKASIETFGITVGEYFQGPLKTVTDLLRDLTNYLAQVNPKVLEIAAYAFTAFAAFLLLGGVLSKTAAMSLRSYKAFIDLARGLQLISVMAEEGTIALTPFGLIVLLIVAALLIIGGTAYVVYKNWDKIWNWIAKHKAYAIIIGILVAMINPLVLLGFFVGALAANWDAALAWMKQAAKDAWDWIQTAAENTKKFVENAWQDLVNWFNNSFIPFFRDTLPTFFKELPGKMKQWAIDAVNAFITELQQLPYQIAYVLGLMVGLFIRAFVDLTLNIPGWILGLVVLITQGLEVLIPWIVDLGSRFVLQVATWIYQLILNLPGWLLDVYMKFVEWGNNIIDWLIPFGVQFLEDTASWAIRIAPTIFEKIWNLPGDLLIFALHMLEQFLAGLNLGLGGTVDFFTGLPYRLFSALGDIVGQFQTIGENIMNGLWRGLRNIADNVASWVKDFAGRMVSEVTHALHLGSPSKIFEKIGENVMVGLLLGLQRNSDPVLAHIDTIANSMAGRASAGTASSVGYRGQGKIHIENTVNVIGANSTKEGKLAGNAAAEAFSDTLSRRQLITTARMV